jgi:hypothetical protein
MLRNPSIPTRRLKKSNIDGGPKNPGSPNSNVLALSKKNSRFSVKKSGKRVRIQFYLRVLARLSFRSNARLEETTAGSHCAFKHFFASCVV